MKKNQKLSLKKEKIAALSKSELGQVKGGRPKSRQLDVCEPSDRSYRSTNAGFTCCLCTGGSATVIDTEE